MKFSTILIGTFCFIGIIAVFSFLQEYVERKNMLRDVKKKERENLEKGLERRGEMKKKVKYLLTENWTLKVFGIETLKNKKIEFKFSAILYSITIFCYFFYATLAILDVNLFNNAEDFISVVSSFRLDYKTFGLACVFGFSSRFFEKFI